MPIHDLMVDFGVSVVLSGHLHNYERIKKIDAYEIGTGIIQLIIGTGGSSHWFTTFDSPDRLFLKSQLQATLGFENITILEKSMLFEFKAVQTGEIFDSFMIETEIKNQRYIQIQGVPKVVMDLSIIILGLFVFFWIYKKFQLRNMKKNLGSLNIDLSQTQ